MGNVTTQWPELAHGTVLPFLAGSDNHMQDLLLNNSRKRIKHDDI